LYNTFFPAKNKIILRKFKTVKSHGVKTLDISNKLTKLIKKQFSNNGGSNFMLPSPDDINKPMEANTLSSIVIRIFGVGVRELRHITITEGRKSLSDEKFNALCNRMNTSSECGLLIYDDRTKSDSKNIGKMSSEQKRIGQMDEELPLVGQRRQTEGKRIYDDDE
jgi:hypothetical protein